MERNRILGLLSLAVFVASAGGAPYLEDFNAGNGGFVPLTVNPPGSQPWTYSTTGGVGNTGSWITQGGETGMPYQQWLSTVFLKVQSAGPVNLEFDHAYTFEPAWDGGVVMVKVNNGAWAQVPMSSFTANGYTGTIQTDAPWPGVFPMNGLDVFNASSGGFVHSVANLGNFNAGDRVRVQFRGGWDWGWAEPPQPNWTVDNVQASNVRPMLQPQLVGALGLSGSTITGKAYVNDLETGTAVPPDRWKLSRLVPFGTGIVGRYYSTDAMSADNGDNGWSVFNTLGSLDTFLAGLTPVQQALASGVALDFPAGGGDDSTNGNPYPVDVGSDKIIGRWSGIFDVPASKAGNWNFWTVSDDGSLLYVDGQLVVYNNYYQGMTERNGSIILGAGPHQLDVAHFEDGGGAGLTAKWQAPGDPTWDYIPWEVLGQDTVQIGDLLALGSFGAFGLPFSADPYSLQLTVEGVDTTVTVTGDFVLTDPASIPEPTTLLLLGGSLLALARRRRK